MLGRTFAPRRLIVTARLHAGPVSAVAAREQFGNALCVSGTREVSAGGGGFIVGFFCHDFAGPRRQNM